MQTNPAPNIQQSARRPVEELFRLASLRAADGSTAASWEAVRGMSLAEYALLQDYTEQLTNTPGRRREQGKPNRQRP